MKMEYYNDYVNYSITYRRIVEVFSNAGYGKTAHNFPQALNNCGSRPSVNSANISLLCMLCVHSEQ